MDLVMVWNMSKSFSLSEADIRNVILKHDHEDCLGHGRHLLNPEVDDDEYKLLIDGCLWLPNLKHYYNPSPQEYCVEMFRTEDTDSILRFAVCDINKKVEHSDDDICEVRLFSKFFSCCLVLRFSSQF